MDIWLYIDLLDFLFGVVVVIGRGVLYYIVGFFC